MRRGVPRIEQSTVEAERGQRVRTTTTLQRALSAAGERGPQVEVYATDEELPSYQRLARAGGGLQWAATSSTPGGVPSSR